MSNNRVTHFEIPADQPEALAKFYGELFGWKFTKAPVPGVEYWLIDTGSGPGINGGITPKMHAQHRWTDYVDVTSIDAAIETATQLGAQVAFPKMEVPGAGWIAAIVDPQGNSCGLWESVPK